MCTSLRKCMIRIHYTIYAVHSEQFPGLNSHRPYNTEITLTFDIKPLRSLLPIPYNTGNECTGQQMPSGTPQLNTNEF